MKKWLLRLVYAALVLMPIGAIADYTATTGSGSTVFAFVCSSTKICPATVLMDSSNVEKATSGNPLRTDPTGTTTQPVSAASLPLPAGAGTSANQTSELTKLDTLHTDLGTLNTTAGAAIAAGTNTIGNVGFDPSSGKATPTEAFLALPATTTTQIIALSGSKVTYVTVAKVLAGGTVNVTFKYGTGSNCGTGTTTLEGPYPLTAQTGYVEGNGAGPVMIVPSAQALCVTTDASVTGGVKLVYQQF